MSTAFPKNARKFVFPYRYPPYFANIDLHIHLYQELRINSY